MQSEALIATISAIIISAGALVTTLINTFKKVKAGIKTVSTDDLVQAISCLTNHKFNCDISYFVDYIDDPVNNYMPPAMLRSKLIHLMQIDMNPAVGVGIAQLLKIFPEGSDIDYAYKLLICLSIAYNPEVYQPNQ